MTTGALPFPNWLQWDEIWIIETIFYGTAFAGTHLRFEFYRDGNLIRGYDFNEGKLISASEDGWPKISTICSKPDVRGRPTGLRRFVAECPTARRQRRCVVFEPTRQHAAGI